MPEPLGRPALPDAPRSPVTFEPTVASIVSRFVVGTLSHAEWDHAAHLAVCLSLLQAPERPEVVLDQLRRLIPAHNERVGIRPDHGAYHETITRYFVEAVAHARPATFADLLADPTCAREAPQRHWSPAVLASLDARRHWVEPDLAPLPWAV